jgi:hypothetical protein
VQAVLEHPALSLGHASIVANASRAHALAPPPSSPSKALARRCARRAESAPFKLELGVATIAA